METFREVKLGFVWTRREQEEKIMLFDWHYAAVSHPFFCEFCDKVNEKIMDEYMSQWSSYEPLERAKEFRWVGFREFMCMQIAIGEQTHGESPFEEEIAATWTY